MVFANKQDLGGSMTLEEIRDVSRVVDHQNDRADRLHTQALALRSIVSHRWVVHPCSAYTGTGLDDGLDWLVKEVAGRLYWSGLNITVAPEDRITQTPPIAAVK